MFYIHSPFARFCKKRTYSSNSVSQLLAAIKQCGKTRNLKQGKTLHINAVENGYHTNKYVANALINMYSKCACVEYARNVFDSMLHRDVVSWTSLILGYVENGESQVGMELFMKMDCEPNPITYVSALKACVGLVTEKRRDKQFCLAKGMDIHRSARVYGFEKECLVATNLVDMYSKCGSMWDARGVFDKMIHWDVVCWNILLFGYVENGESLLAMELFASMSFERDSVTYVAALKACISEHELEKGMDIHMQARADGFDKELLVATNLIDMYSKCGSMFDARGVFDKMARWSVVTWNILLFGYVENGESLIAMELFTSMKCERDSVTFVAGIKACTELVCLTKGTAIGRQARECGYDTDLFVGNSLVEMFSKCGSMQRAQECFNRILHVDVVSYTNLIMGYVADGESSVAMDLLTSMECDPDCVTFVAVLKACGSVSSLNTGRVLHTHICKRGFDENQGVVNSLVDFYGKCGSMSAAEHVYNAMCLPDKITWSNLISGYSSLGDIHKVCYLVNTMLECGICMDSYMYVWILTACSHAGMVEEGKKYLKSMSKYGINPGIEHYTCMVDMLSRANRLEEALLIVKGMPFEGSNIAWTSVLGMTWK